MPYKINAFNYPDILALKLAEDNHPTALVQRDTYHTHFILNKLNEEEITTSKATHPPVDKINSMDLEIIVNDNVKPRYLIRFYHMPHIRIRKDSPKYHAFFSERQQWFTILQAIIHEAEDTVTAPNSEHPIETIELSINEETVKEATQIMMDDNTKHYSLRLLEESKDTAEHNPEYNHMPKQIVEKPISYFDQLIEKNRRQMRGDYTDE